MPNKLWARQRDDSGASEEWLGGRRWTGFAALGFVVVLAIAAAIILLLGRHDHPERGAATPAAAASGGAPTPAPSGCELAPPPSGELDVPSSAPAGVSWTLLQGTWLPSSRPAGPGTVDGRVAGCWAHTPVGALLAAAQIPFRYGTAGDAEWQATVVMLAPGPGRDAFVRQRTTDRLDPAPAIPPQIVGFQFLSYTPTAATVEIVLRYHPAQLVAAEQRVAWYENDWKYVADPAGGPWNLHEVPDLTGYIPWGGS